MLLRGVFLLTILFYFAESKTEENIITDSNKMMGFDTVQGVKLDKIDKDTVITRHMNTLKVTKRGKSAGVATLYPEAQCWQTWWTDYIRWRKTEACGSPCKTPMSRSVDKEEESSKKNQESPDWSYSSFPEEVKNHVDDFKRNMSECLREVQASDKRPVRRLSPNKESPVHGECLIACVLKRNGVIEHGKVSKENLLTLVRKFYAKDQKLIKKLEKNLDRCIEASVRSKDDCAIAARLNECTNDLMAHSKHKPTVKY